MLLNYFDRDFVELLVSPASKVLNNWFEVVHFHDYFACCRDKKLLPLVSTTSQLLLHFPGS